jgi:hypothetical protein
MSLGIGKKTLKRRAMNLRLKKRHIENGYPQTCEIKLPKCMGSWANGWAHSKKSRYITTDELWMTAVLACPQCHETIEAMSHDAMEKIVLDIIANRPNPV